MKHVAGKVEIWEQKVTIPTYEVGEPDKNPMYFENRVYQGQSGKVYPLPVIEKIYDEKVDKDYNAVFLENDYLQVMIFPERGGRIQRALDKTNNYDFIYYNEVVKPALVGLAGPWVSGGVEFNWPQTHRPTTFSPVDYTICENEDGSKTVKVSETDQMYGTKGMASFTLYPDKAFIEIKGQLYNPTELPQTFLWWANPAVAVNENTQSVFPPDVTAVLDHGKSAVSKWPIATGEFGVYDKYDLSDGVDISYYRNVPVPMSCMVHKSEYGFVGNYDHKVKGGLLHLAGPHVSPGKKQWSWGTGSFGNAWELNLTDENGQYNELMAGVFSDNQPDFAWLKPFEEKKFTQYFMPYKEVGLVKNASTDVVMNVEIKDDSVDIIVYGVAEFDNAKIVLSTLDGQILFESVQKISPVDIVSANVPIKGLVSYETVLSVYDENGKLLLDYVANKPKIEILPDADEPSELPENIRTNEELYLTGMHLEQYRHATFAPDPYYLEAIKRDDGDIRNNTAYGMLLMRRGQFKASEEHFRKAMKRATMKNGNPYDSAPIFNLGLSLLYQGDRKQAYERFYKATWTSEHQEKAFFYLAVIDGYNGNYEQALSHVEKSLVKNSHNIKARGLKAILLRLLGKNEQAIAWAKSSVQVDPFDYVSRLELYKQGKMQLDTILRFMRNNADTFMATAKDYAACGLFEEAIEILEMCKSMSPMIAYYCAYYKNEAGKDSSAYLAEAALRSPLCCFPNKLTDILVLEYAIKANDKDAKAPYYLGNLLYDSKQYSQARDLWEKSVAIDDSFPTVHRNLSLAYYNKDKDANKAKASLEKAFSLDETDARVFMELDDLRKKLNYSIEERKDFFDKYTDVFETRDDLCVEYITLLNLIGDYEQAYSRLKGKIFHPWEGGEGRVTRQFVITLKHLADEALKVGDAKAAKQYMLDTLEFPRNLGEGRIKGTAMNDLHYKLGIICEALGEQGEAKKYFELATEPLTKFSDMYLYQGFAYQKLGMDGKAHGAFYRLVDHGERHMFDKVTLGYFAISLPDLQLFDGDLSLINKANCYYMIALGSYGLGDKARTSECFSETLKIDCSHIDAILYKRDFEA